MTTAWLFPGQGSQHVGMAEKWLAQSECARSAIEEASDELGFDFAHLLREGPPEDLDRTELAQPAILAASVAILRAAGEDLPPPTLVAGHSMGEYSALVATGACSYPDALRLVNERGRLMRLAGDLRPGRMAAVLGVADADVAAACAAVVGVQVANYNAPGQVVISGEEAAVAEVTAALLAAGAKRVVPLAVSIAAHSALMAPVAAEFARAVGAVSVGAPSVPIVLNRTAEATTEPDKIRSALADQLTHPVQWTATIQAMLAAGVETFMEIGPGTVLTGITKRITRGSQQPVSAVSLSEPLSAAAGSANA